MHFAQSYIRLFVPSFFPLLFAVLQWSLNCFSIVSLVFFTTASIPPYSLFSQWKYPMRKHYRKNCQFSRILCHFLFHFHERDLYCFKSHKKNVLKPAVLSASFLDKFASPIWGVFCSVPMGFSCEFVAFSFRFPGLILWRFFLHFVACPFILPCLSFLSRDVEFVTRFVLAFVIPYQKYSSLLLPDNFTYFGFACSSALYAALDFQCCDNGLPILLICLNYSSCSQILGFWLSLS